jgi:hypothetical protein
MSSLTSDTVAVSESAGVGLLIGMTVIVTAVVGINVLVVEQDDGGPQANFTYDHVSGQDILIVRYSSGDSFQAGDIEFNGPAGNATWAELSDWNETDMAGPGDITQLAESNAYGESVSSTDTITVYYNESGNRTQLSQWNTPAEGFDEGGDSDVPTPGV